MTKEEAKNKLQKAGYQVADDNSMVIIQVPIGTDMKKHVKEIKQKLSEMGYDESFSIRQVKNALDQAMDEIEFFDLNDEPDSKKDADGFDAGSEGSEALEERPMHQFSLEDFGLDF